MATYRMLRVDFWQDAFVLDLTPEEKYFYIYLMTNGRTTQCGIYELPFRIIELDTGYHKETIQKLIDRFIEYKKVQYNHSTQEVFLLNWAKYNFTASPKVMACIKKELKEVKYQPFLKTYYEQVEGLGYHIDTISIDYGEKEKEKEKENKREEIPFYEIISYLNRKTNKNFRPNTKKTKELIKARWNEKYTLDDFKKVIDVKCTEWLNKDKEMYLRPETLFGTKFEGYLNQKGASNYGQNGTSFAGNSRKSLSEQANERSRRNAQQQNGEGELPL